MCASGVAEPRVSGEQVGKGWEVALPEKAFASFTCHDVEVITSGLVPTYTADLGTPISLMGIDGWLSRSGVCSFAAHEVSMVPALFRSHLQLGFWAPCTRSEKNHREWEGWAGCAGAVLSVCHSHLALWTLELPLMEEMGVGLELF